MTWRPAGIQRKIHPVPDRCNGCAGDGQASSAWPGICLGLGKWKTGGSATCLTTIQAPDQWHPVGCLSIPPAGVGEDADWSSGAVEAFLPRQPP